VELAGFHPLSARDLPAFEERQLESGRICGNLVGNHPAWRDILSDITIASTLPKKQDAGDVLF
jgi:hypothetical protein